MTSSPPKPLGPAQALQSPVHLDELWAEIQTLHEKLNNFIASHKACCVHHSNSLPNSQRQTLENHMANPLYPPPPPPFLKTIRKTIATDCYDSVLQPFGTVLKICSAAGQIDSQIFSDLQNFCHLADAAISSSSVSVSSNCQWVDHGLLLTISKVTGGLLV
ncbi:hypothetical protein EDD15DRAFT_2205628 [Pisolithus albus]|nr:hypothetical protein EDD15DRAFT_2205628 [Pisolithus albus]